MRNSCPIENPVSHKYESTKTEKFGQTIADLLIFALICSDNQATTVPRFVLFALQCMISGHRILREKNGSYNSQLGWAVRSIIYHSTADVFSFVQNLIFTHL